VEEATPEVLAAVPTSIEDIPVMVRVTGPIRILAISPLSLQAMTAAGGWNQPGTPVIQPAPYDTGTLADRIGELERIVEIKPEDEGENLVDASSAIPDSPFLVSKEILEVGSVYGWSDPVADAILEKSGRTTCRRSGRIVDVNGTVRVEGYPGGAAIFKDQIMFENPNWSVIAPGDSGSLAFTTIGGLPYAIGLCFAGSSSIGVANKIRNVINLLGIDMGLYVPPEVPPPPGPPTWWDTVRILGMATGPIAIGGVIISEEARKGVWV